MADIHRVQNLKEALDLARQFKSTGHYNLFRGQGQNWKVIPTIGRLSKSEFAETKEKLERLYYFFETNLSLAKFATNIDWFYAVAQHYGIPTSYIDFSYSPEVAAFFATHSRSNKIGEDCVILCLNENDFNEFIQITKGIYSSDKVIAPYIIKINVDNLWRLQTQKGCFLFTPYADIEFYYDFDKIIFPYHAPYSDIPIEEIYPKRKSELEILLDHFFNSERKIVGQKRLKRFIEETKILHVSLPKLEFGNLIKTNQIHPSWNSKEHNKWIFAVKEEWHTSEVTENIEVHFSFKNEFETQVQFLIEELSNCFKDKEIDRNAILNFEVIAIPKLSKKMSKIVNQSCKRIWDGTRNLPYTDNDIFEIISKYICLEIYANKFDSTPSMTKEELITLELTNEYGSITRCYVSPSKIVSSFRPDIKDIIADELTEDISSRILLHINQPDLLFDFNDLVRLFKDELISYQVLYNSEKKNPVIFYTPTQITVLGYA